jgi:hypothetical protein
MNKPSVIDCYFQVQEQSKRGHPNFAWSNIDTQHTFKESAERVVESLSPSRRQAYNFRIVKRTVTEEVVG